MNCKILSFLIASALAITAGPALASSEGGSTAWVSSNHIQVIDIDRGTVLARLPLAEFIHEMQFNGTGQRLYVATSKALRLVDPEAMAFTGVLSLRRTKALAVSKDGEHVFAIHPGDPEISQRARRAGTPLPLATLSHYSTATLSQTSSWQVPAMSSDVAISPRGDRVFVVDPNASQVQIYAANGELLERITVVPQDSKGRPQQAMLGAMAIAPDGHSLVLPVTTASGALLAEIDLAPAAKARKVTHEPLRSSGRIQGLSWNSAGNGVLITSVGGLCDYSGPGTEQVWQAQSVNYVDIEAVPTSGVSVAVAPVFSEANKSGGVSVLSANGKVLRSIELPDMSPFLVVVRP